MKLINWIIIKWQLVMDWFSRHLFGHSILSSVKVTPHVYLGGSFTAENLKRIKKWGITAVVSMREAEPPLGIKTLHLPTRDGHAPTPEDLEEGVEFIRKEVAKDGRVYVHCREGIGRGPTMMIAYLISIGYGLDEAIKLIKKVRVFIKPTTPQINALKKYEQKIEKKGTVHPEES
ncbi:protein phosphatase [Candidatus Peregrinibacteria bacterium]|nr:protein phosphatase [Candidatus Peregrinibacteria bacterium]